MSNPASDRNLLYGLHALQNGLISDVQLIAALKMWSFSKEVPLGEILVQLGSLTDDLRLRLDRMVTDHIALFDGDAGRSLALLSSVDGIAQAIGREVEDEDVNRSLATISVRQISPKSVFATQSYSPAQAVQNLVSPNESGGKQNTTSHPPSRAKGDINRFQILQEHATGGLGRVSIALDSELNRRVALKEIRPEHSSQIESRSRFVREAEITGQLEHPGIVPIYALGAHADGRPYYAMRFVKGDSLKTAISRYYEQKDADTPERNLQFREMLRRFVDVCNAIGYAHSRGVLHRDLKPDNIMLGKFGETLVVDWGLAKAGRDQDIESSNPDQSMLIAGTLSGNSDTVAGHAIGTPAYMSPEQAEGKLAELGPTSDVYSLGATLYHVLTGSPAFRSSEESPVIKRVIAGEFPAPRAVNPKASKVLEAVCLKSMSLQQSNRYQTPGELAAEVERWLADEPVLASPDTKVEKLSRWLRKNRSTAVAGVSVLFVTAIAAAAVAVIVSATNQGIEASNRLLTASEALERKARERAEESEVQARASEAKAKEYLRSAAYALIGLDQTKDLQSLMPDIGDFELNIPTGADRASVYQLLTIASGRNLPDISPAAVESFLAGMPLLKNRQSTEAYPFLKKAADLEPDIRIFGFAACLAATNIKDYDEAESLARTLVDKFPDDAELTTHLGSILQMRALSKDDPTRSRAELFQEARTWLKKSIELSPRAIEARTLLAELAEGGTLPELQEAEKSLREVVTLSSDPSHRYALVFNLSEQNRAEDALAEIRPLLALEKQQPAYNEKAADLLRQNKLFEEADTFYQKFETAKQNDAGYDDHTIYLNNWGVMLVQLRQFSRALEKFTEFRKRDTGNKDNPAILINEARARLGAKELDKAVELAEQARTTSDDPLEMSVVVDSMLVLTCAGKYEQATELANRIDFKIPSTPDRFSTLFIGLKRILTLVQNNDAASGKALPELAELPGPISEDWDYYFLDRWAGELAEPDQNKVLPVIAALKKAVPVGAGVPWQAASEK